MSKPLTILGLESSCDDTAAAVVQTGEPRVLSSIVFTQTDIHAAFGGVVPEIAARAHTEKLDICVEQAINVAGISLANIDAIAVTSGPGLVGGVLAGVMFARGLAAGLKVPLIGVNHLAGHALTPRMTDDLPFPYLMLLVSGGHCQFLLVQGVEKFTRLGGTIDDAPGEAFDKIARLLALPQPGGPSVEDAAQRGNASVFPLPRPLLNRPDCDMSFSGLKTAVLRTRDQIIAEHGGLPSALRNDLCASFQAAVADVLAAKTQRALAKALEITGQPVALAVAGGVASNGTIRTKLKLISNDFVAPPLKYCTDNAAMIAWAGLEKFRLGLIDPADLIARPRWPLDQTSPAMLGSGKKGAKA